MIKSNESLCFIQLLNVSNIWEYFEKVKLEQLDYTFSRGP